MDHGASNIHCVVFGSVGTHQLFFQVCLRRSPPSGSVGAKVRWIASYAYYTARLPTPNQQIIVQMRHM